MATNKKSFILYADIKTTIDKLDNEYAGKLFKHILAYVNDENPTTDDLLLEVAFEPIKRQFKRDLEKWQQIKSKRSEAGKASAESRKQKATKPTSVESVQQSSTNPTVNVNVNDNVNVNVNETVINKKKNIKKEVLVYPFDSIEFKKSIEIWKQYKLEQHRFKFKSLASEQAMLKTIGKDYNNETEAIEAIEYSMANGYKGIFKPQKTLINASNDKNQYGNLKTDLLKRFS